MKKFIFWIYNFKKYLNKKKYSLFALVVTFFIIFSSLQAGINVDPDLDPRNYAKGAMPLSPEQVESIEKNWPRVLGVRPNKYGAARIQESMLKRGFSKRSVQAVEAIVEEEDEFITNKNSPDYDPEQDSSSLFRAAALPSKVDNSKLACFPPIGNQRSQGSCVGWASTYYHATHEYGLLNGLNNKTSSQGIRSPKWTYNMINFGVDSGAYPSDAYELLKTNGAPGMNDFPYDTNYRAWDLKTQDWISAMSYRMKAPSFITVTSPTEVDVVKQILNNGHVVTALTYASSWQFSKVSADPSQSNPYVGQRAIHWMNGTSGGHHITIVGYDDNIWIDVNGNGKVDSGEKGAFLIANSWGTGWGNAGYIWVAYDAFYTTTRVPNGPTTNRRRFASTVFSTTPIKANYVPKAIAKFSISQTSRKELKLSLGVSSISQSAPSKKFVSGALTGDGGAYAYDGQTPRLQTATFALDATDLLPTTNIAQKYYLILEDTTSGNKTTLNSYSIVDLATNKEVSYKGTPLTVDKSIIQPNIVFQPGDAPTPTPTPTPTPVKPTISISSPSNLATVSGSLAVTASVNNVTVTKVEFFVDSKLASTDTSAPYVLPLDTTKYTNGQHTITAVVYDNAGNTANDNIIVTVQNAESKDFPNYLSYQQKKDSGWVSGAQYSATIKNQGTTPISNLKIKFLTAPSNIYLWNVAVVSSDSQSVTIGLPSWKPSLAPGETLTLGFVIQPEVEPRVSFVSATQG